jgi:proteasome lid subunit RPN8/RPN11
MIQFTRKISGSRPPPPASAMCPSRAEMAWVRATKAGLSLQVILFHSSPSPSSLLSLDSSQEKRSATWFWKAWAAARLPSLARAAVGVHLRATVRVCSWRENEFVYGVVVRKIPQILGYSSEYRGIPLAPPVMLMTEYCWPHCRCGIIYVEI